MVIEIYDIAESCNVLFDLYKSRLVLSVHAEGIIILSLI